MRSPISSPRPQGRRFVPSFSKSGPPPVARGVVRVTHPHGLHARASILLNRLLLRFDAEVELSVGSLQADGREAEQILLLGASEGDAIAVTCRGAEAAPALAAVEAFFRSDFLVSEGGAR